MKGSPPLEILLILLLFGAALVPLTKLTGNRFPVSEHIEEGTETAIPTFATLRFSVIPEKLTVSQESGNLIDAAIEENEVELDFESSDEGADLRVIASFPEGSIPVLEITVEPDALPSQSQTIWLETHEADEIVSFTW